jgi:hypothetical protein
MTFEQINGVYVIKDYVPVQWGHFSWIQAILHCINWSLSQVLEFDWLILLSGQDYPIQPLCKIENFLQETKYDGFMEYFLAEAPPETPTKSGLKWDKCTGRDRFFCQYYRLPSPTPSFLKKILFHLGRMSQWQSLVRLVVGREGTLIGLKSLSTPFTKSFRCYAGSNWFTLSYSCIRYIHNFVQQNTAFVDYYKNTIIPEESFFHTILINQSEFNISKENMRYIRWHSSNTGSPAILGVQDFEDLRNSNKHFARKFDVKVDSKILDLLDNYMSDSI